MTTAEIQTKLAALGLYGGSIDGQSSPDLVESVKAFQRANGLADDGIVGPKTTTALNGEPAPAPAKPKPAPVAPAPAKQQKAGDIAPDIIAAAQAAQRKHDVPASVTLAQFAVESAWGAKVPVGSHNPFGIKASGAQPYVVARTREEKPDGSSYYIDAKFRKFADFAEAFDAHGQLLATATPYATARAAWKSTHSVTDYVKEMAKRYATDHNYATLILGIIKSHNLTQYDVGAKS